MAIDAAKYPQLARMEEVQSESQLLGDFIEWLGEHGMVICKPHQEFRGVAHYPILESTEKLLATRFGVDLNAAERERRAVLAEFTASRNAA